MGMKSKVHDQMEGNLIFDSLCMTAQFIYRIYTPTGGTQLYVFIIYFGLVMLLVAQLPSFHSLRYINLVSVLCCLGYSLCVVAGSIYAGGIHLFTCLHLANLSSCFVHFRHR